MTQTVSLLGFPLKHSISPAFQQAAFDFYKLDLRYEAWDVPPEGLGDAVARLRQPQSLGANVTVPYKEAVVPLLDEVVGVAAGIGAVNTIAKREGRLLGYNTDVSGFLRALREVGGFDPRGKDVVVLGAGGAARAVAFGLLGAGIVSLTLVNRTEGRVLRLAQELASQFGAPVHARPWGELASALARCQLLINATTLGMKHGPDEAQSPLAAGDIPEGVLIYDLVYNPIETPLLEEARKAKANVMGGFCMLIYQGADAFELWTGREVYVDIMFQAARRALEA